MTPDHWLLFILLAGMVYLFFTQLIPIDLTSLLVVAILTGAGLLSAEEAFRGFSSPTVITMIATFFVTGALRRTGVANTIGGYMHRISGKSEALNVLAVVVVSAFFSSFMNNVAATALLMPAVASLSYNSSVPPSKLLIPLSFGTLLGGTLTLIGTTPNLLAADVLRARGLEPFSFLEFTPYGLSFVLVGSIFLAVWGRKFLPSLSQGGRRARGGDLPKLYRLHERLFTMRVPPGSALHNRSLEEIHFGKELGASVVSIIRGDERKLDPRGDDLVFENDVLVVRGRSFELEALSRLRGVSVEALQHISDLQRKFGLVGAVAEFHDKQFFKAPLSGLSLRERFGLVVVGIERKGSLIQRGLADTSIQEGDKVHVVVLESALGRLKESTLFSLAPSDIPLPELHTSSLLLVSVPHRSPLHNVSIRDSQLGKLTDISILCILREEGRPIYAHPDERIRSGDKMVVVGDTVRLRRLIELSRLEIGSLSEEDLFLESNEIGVIEVVLSPRSSLLNATLAQVNFRERYALQALAIWRQGHPIRHRLASLPMEFGDALLLYGPKQRMSLLLNDPDFVVLSDLKDASFRLEKVYIALGGLALLVLLPAFGLQSVEVSAFFAALFVVLFRAISMDEAYKEIEWRVIALIVSMIPIGLAVENTGVLTKSAHLLMDIAGPAGPYVMLLVLTIFASLLSQLLDNTIAVILLVPIGIEMSYKFNTHPHSFAMAITLASSICFMTPFSHRANLLIMSAGGYRSRDYLKIGTILSILTVICVLVLVPLLYGFSSR